MLLTATPLQNTLQELYGLVSIIDELVFGDLKSYKSQYCNIRNDDEYDSLRERLKTVCQRTLRRQVLEYIRYTNRIPITQEFVPTPEEQRLYDLVSQYLQRENLYALPSSQRKLMTLILRKLLASSTYAISGTLGALASRLENVAKEHAETTLETEEVSPDYETIDEIEDELCDDDNDIKESVWLTSEQLAEVEQERRALIDFKTLADSIVKNSKGEALMSALRKGFEKAHELGAPQKAIVFTESTRTQQYLLQVNYDPPWNPQRIGRCHRYGQNYDVVVVNFLNKNNAADQRVYELLKDKFRLFSGVFGASDEVPGSIESGVDFETRIASIYQSCRSTDEIEAAFNKLQSEMEEQIDERMKDTRRKLLENFDEEVQEKLRLQLRESTEALGRYEQWLWSLTRYFLRDCSEFHDEEKYFQLFANPFPGETIHPGPYRIGRHVEDVNIYRVGHPLAQRIISHCKGLVLPRAEIRFDYSGTGRNIAVMESLRGQCGWLTAHAITISAFETQDYVLMVGQRDDGTPMLQEQCQRLFSLAGTVSEFADDANTASMEAMQRSLAIQRGSILDELSAKNAVYFDAELDKLDRWGDDQRATLKLELKDLEEQIKNVKRSARNAANLPEKLVLERQKRQLDAKRDEAWKEYELAARNIETKKDALMDEVEKRMQQQVGENELFTIRWRVG